MRNASLAFLFSLSVLILNAQTSMIDPAAALAEGRAHIASARYDAAIGVLVPAIEVAKGMKDQAIRTQALAALHFYTGSAYAGLRDTSSATSHIREFQKLSPESRSVDPKKHNARFVALFNDLAASVANGETFGSIYPGFSTALVGDSASEREMRNNDPAVAILGTKSEQRAYGRLSGKEERESYMNLFWGRREISPGTERNEFRDMFYRRVIFADGVFGTREKRGTLTDRGRVFTTLGEPAYVERRPITNQDRLQLVDKQVNIDGTIEHWVYLESQLSTNIPKDKILFRFVTQRGIGEGILQREEAAAMRALGAAALPRTQ